MEKVYYTLAEANAMLPFVRDRLAKMRTTKKEITAVIVQLRKSGIDFEGLFKKNEMSPDEALYRQKLEALGDQINGMVFEFEEKGIFLKDIDSGLIDFLTRINDEDAFLCWKHGEPEVAFWHGITEGFSGRRSLFERQILENVARVH